MNEYFIIVGANGDIGFEILKSLNDDNHNIIATYNNTKPNIKDFKFPEKIQIEKLDLSSNKSIIDFVKRVKDQKVKDAWGYMVILCLFCCIGYRVW